jgi:hypothetical protein
MLAASAPEPMPKATFVRIGRRAEVVLAAVVAPIQAPHTTACLCDCLHVDDLAELLKEKGRASNRLSSCLRALVVHSPRRGA